MCAWVCATMNGSMQSCMQLCMDVCNCAWMYAIMHGCVQLCTDVCNHACNYAWMCATMCPLQGACVGERAAVHPQDAAQRGGGGADGAAGPAGHGRARLRGAAAGALGWGQRGWRQCGGDIAVVALRWGQRRGGCAVAECRQIVVTEFVVSVWCQCGVRWCLFWPCGLGWVAPCVSRHVICLLGR